MAKLSIIIPVYGVEKYIEKCVRSLFEQTLDDIEYIFVDDCTPDRSIGILESLLNEYPSRIDQVTILHHKENKGLPIARQTGIKEAHGDYILHCDSDDWIEKNACELLYQRAVETNADMVISDYYRVNKEGVNSCAGCISNLSRNEIIYKMYYQKVPYMVWNKLIRRELYNYIEEYPLQTHGEDFAIILQLAYYTKEIQYIPIPLYYYRIGSETAIHIESEENRVKKFEAAVENARIIERFFIGKDIDVHLQNGLMWLKNCQRGKLIPLLKKDKYYKLWKSTFPEINIKLFFNGDLNILYKIKYFLIYFRLFQFNEK